MVASQSRVERLAHEQLLSATDHVCIRRARLSDASSCILRADQGALRLACLPTWINKCQTAQASRSDNVTARRRNVYNSELCSCCSNVR